MLAGYAAYSVHHEGATHSEILWGLSMGCASILWTSSVVSNYFSSQIPRPPAPKKSLWNVIEEAVYARMPGKKPAAVSNS